jgi:hypothetical protein
VPIGDQAIIHGAYRTITWGIIPISTFAGGAFVTVLAERLAIVDAAKVAMLAATVIGVLAIIPLAGMQRLLTTAPPMAPNEQPETPAESVIGAKAS